MATLKPPGLLIDVLGGSPTPGGRLVFHLFAALGQFESDPIRERTRAGLITAAWRTTRLHRA